MQTATASGVVKYTQLAVERLEKTWSGYAGEKVTAHHDTVGLVVGVDAVLVFGSELAMYRLHYKLGCVGLVFQAADGRWFYRSKKI